ncbi:PQQ-binding-like beta-propeller repeat protein [Variovorax sp. LT2P21]|uniref:PQQ-binding-like beta-propeller repeat protein n=1 Tax=Variovorax sp. LT2P21 TaxID=3443731 RepID=UPI003F453C3B
MKPPLLATSLRRAAWAAPLFMLLAACSGAGGPRPAELPPDRALLRLQPSWVAQPPAKAFPLRATANGEQVTLVGADGLVMAIDGRSGRELWRAQAGAPVEVGAGSDGSVTAVVTKDNQLAVLRDGKPAWTGRLDARAFTPPLVAGGRVFVHTASRTISAWDAQTGQQLWSRSRVGDSLVLNQPGVLIAVRNTIVTSLGARLVGLEPANGASLWEAPIATTRGVTEVERMIDLTGGVSRVGDSVCARAYAATVGCVQAARGDLVWRKTAQGAEGLAGDVEAVYGSEGDGTLVAWRRADGALAWRSDPLRHRQLSAPLIYGDALVVAERSGTLHLASRSDGALLGRTTPDGSAIDTAPVLAGNTLVVVTRKGVYGYRATE